MMSWCASQDFGVDLDADWDEIKELITQNPYHALPVYRENIKSNCGGAAFTCLSHMVLKHQVMDKDLLVKMVH